MKSKVIFLSIILLLIGGMTYANTSQPTDLITRYEMEQTIKANDTEQRTLDAINKNIDASVQVRSGGSIGSGFYVTDKLILTAYHVLDKGDIHITLNNGKRINGTVVKTDMFMDFALIEVEEAGKPVVIADKVKLGETAIAIGSPIELSNTVTKGIVSGLDMDINKRKMTQIDVPVNKGSSGGMLLNLDGKLIGMVQSRIVKDKDTEDVVNGISFAAKLEDIKEFIK
jgi:serine protease Do